MSTTNFEPIHSSDIFAVTFNSDKELLLSQVLPAHSEKWIRFQLSQLAAQKAALVPDSQDLTRYLQQEADLRGQVNALRYLLDCSQAAQQTLTDSQE